MSQRINYKENMMISRYKPYIGILIFGIIIVITFFVGDFLNNLVNKQQGSIDKKKNEIASRENMITEITRVKEDIPDFNQKVKILDNLEFPSSGVGASQFLAQIEVIAKKSGVALASISPSTQANGFSATVQVTGLDSNIATFIKNLERNMLIINVNNISIFYGEESSQATLTITTGM